jgi:hypothetical protein
LRNRKAIWRRRVPLLDAWADRRPSERGGSAVKALEVIANTDPLAQFALAGLAVTILVTLVLFGYLLTRRDQPKGK